MTADAVLPSANPSDAAEAFVMMETISTPGAISRLTSQLTAPSTSLVTFPFRMLRALICIVGRIVSNGSRRSNHFRSYLTCAPLCPPYPKRLSQCLSLGKAPCRARLRVGRGSVRAVVCASSAAQAELPSRASLRQPGFSLGRLHPPWQPCRGVRPRRNGSRMSFRDTCETDCRMPGSQIILRM
jgi:hypothetical protein